jgi:hypothetical protein
MTGDVVFVIPVWVLNRGADIIFLVLAGLAYFLYTVGVIVLLRADAQGNPGSLGKQWRTLLEPLLCLPNGAHLCRKLCERYQLAVPLIDLLHSDVELTGPDLHDLLRHIEELTSVCDEAADQARLVDIKMLIDTRLNELSR